MPTRNVNLTQHYHEFVEAQIRSGRFKNASEVMRAGLRLLEQTTATEEEKLNLLRSLAGEGFAELDQGAGIRLETPVEVADFVARIGERVARGQSE